MQNVWLSTTNPCTHWMSGARRASTSLEDSMLARSCAGVEAPMRGASRSTTYFFMAVFPVLCAAADHEVCVGPVARDGRHLRERSPRRPVTRLEHSSNRSGTDRVRAALRWPDSMTAPRPPEVFRFGPFRLDVHERQLL